MSLREALYKKKLCALEEDRYALNSKSNQPRTPVKHYMKGLDT